MIRIAIVSMLVRDALPSEIPFAVRAAPWGLETVSDEQPSGAAGSASAGISPGSEPLLSFSVYRDEFTQEGPSGPIEAKRILLLRALPLTRTKVTFDIEPGLMQQLGFCVTPPLLIDHRPPTAAEGADAELSQPTPEDARPPAAGRAPPSAPVAIF
jgi:hypothetical protein